MLPSPQKTSLDPADEEGFFVSDLDPTGLVALQGSKDHTSFGLADNFVLCSRSAADIDYLFFHHQMGCAVDQFFKNPASIVFIVNNLVPASPSADYL